MSGEPAHLRSLDLGIRHVPAAKPATALDALLRTNRGVNESSELAVKYLAPNNLHGGS
jgi:hypothetical protein